VYSFFTLNRVTLHIGVSRMGGLGRRFGKAPRYWTAARDPRPLKMRQMPAARSNLGRLIIIVIWPQPRDSDVSHLRRASTLEMVKW
jgi:hypothetical protein